MCYQSLPMGKPRRIGATGQEDVRSENGCKLAQDCFVQQCQMSNYFNNVLEVVAKDSVVQCQGCAVVSDSTS